MVDMFAPSLPGGGVTSPLLIQAQQTDPRFALAKAMMQSANESRAPLYSPWQALAKALQGGLAGASTAALGQEYETRQKSLADTSARALEAGQTGIKEWRDPGTLNPDTGATEGAGKVLVRGQAPGMAALASVLAQSDDPIAKQMGFQAGAQTLTPDAQKAQLALTLAVAQMNARARATGQPEIPMPGAMPMGSAVSASSSGGGATAPADAAAPNFTAGGDLPQPPARSPPPNVQAAPVSGFAAGAGLPEPPASAIPSQPAPRSAPGVIPTDRPLTPQQMMQRANDFAIAGDDKQAAYWYDLALKAPRITGADFSQTVRKGGEADPTEIASSKLAEGGFVNGKYVPGLVNAKAGMAGAEAGAQARAKVPFETDNVQNVGAFPKWRVLGWPSPNGPGPALPGAPQAGGAPGAPSAGAVTPPPSPAVSPAASLSGGEPPASPVQYLPGGGVALVPYNNAEPAYKTDLAKDMVGFRRDAIKNATEAQRTDASLVQFETAMAEMGKRGTQTGYFTPALAQIAAGAKSLGIDTSAIPGVPKPEDVGDAQTAAKVSKAIFGEVLKKMFPQRITNVDMKVMEGIAPGLGIDPRANENLIAAIRGQNSYDKDIATKMLDYEHDHNNLYGFEREHYAKSGFGPLSFAYNKEPQAASGSAPPAGVPAGSTPAGVEKGTNKPVWKTPDGKHVVVD